MFPRRAHSQRLHPSLAQQPWGFPPPQRPSYTFPVSYFSVWANLWCRHTLTIDSSGPAPVLVLPSTQAPTRFPLSQECSGSTSRCPVSCTVHVSPPDRDGQGGSTLRQALRHTTTAGTHELPHQPLGYSTSRKLLGTGLSDGGPCPSGFPAASTGVYNQLFMVSTL